MMNIQNSKLAGWRRSLGLLVMIIGALVLFAPIFVGGWVIALLGVALIAAGLFQFAQLLRPQEKHKSITAYVAGTVTILLGVVLFLSPDLAMSGLLLGVTGFFVIDGGTKFYEAYKESGARRWWALFNGLCLIIIGLALWSFLSGSLGTVAVGVALGVRLLMQGWSMFFQPPQSFQHPDTPTELREHPDQLLRLAPSDLVKEIQETIVKRDALWQGSYKALSLKLLILFFAIHVLRTEARWSFIGFISPFSAVVGDAIVAIILAVVVVLPLRLVWRKFSRPIERAAWNRLAFLSETGEEPSYAERLLRSWLIIRMKFAIDMRNLRTSMSSALWQLLRIGLPLTTILIAVNSIWGFSWYFNSENWASGVWQRLTQERVDVWRQRMAEDVEKAAVANGLEANKVFAIQPPDITDNGDFSFIVIGDTGEGDPSQMSLREQIIAASHREDVKFLVLSSDVIYPDGKMKDYETNFYLPFMGFEKPIYAIPGNHDWFDADEAFNANFLDHDAAILSMRARLAVDLKTRLITTDPLFEDLTAEARRLREYYRIRNGLQRGPFFDFHTTGFSLIAVDTGILRTIDEKQQAWLEGALTRAGNSFKMVVIGHPFYVAGNYQGANDKAFNNIHEILKRFSVDTIMAGDTHDFEFYKVKYPSPVGDREVFNFVNGGGGAYLSIGTALGFSSQPVTSDYAYYPRTDKLMSKIQKEAPLWKAPFILWMRWLHGYPFDNEMVSGAFDFNRAPFFQSFMEVKVERSQQRVRYLLYGVNGQLRWRDIQVNGQVKPADKSDDDFVEFTMPLHR